MQPATSRLAARAALDLLVYSPLDWPGKTVRLDPDSVQSYLQRTSSGVPSVAEVYHANSRLGPAIVGRLLGARTDVAELRRVTVERSAAATSRSGKTGAPAPRWLTALLRATRDAAGTDLFYALELRLVHAGVVYAFEPLSGRCPVVALLTAADAEAVERAVRLLGSRSAEPDAVAGNPGGSIGADALVLVVGRFGRHDVLYGPRGYRRTLIEAGRLSQEMLRLAGGKGIGASVITEFADEEVDAAALADGVEDGCLVVIELKRVHDEDE